MDRCWIRSRFLGRFRCATFEHRVFCWLQIRDVQQARCQSGDRTRWTESAMEIYSVGLLLLHVFICSIQHAFVRYGCDAGVNTCFAKKKECCVLMSASFFLVSLSASSAERPFLSVCKCWKLKAQNWDQDGLPSREATKDFYWLAWMGDSCTYPAIFQGVVCYYFDPRKRFVLSMAMSILSTVVFLTSLVCT